MNTTLDITTVENLYNYLDGLFEQNIDDDSLFASGYIRGFISLAASDYGDEQQVISEALVNAIGLGLQQAKKELTPQDSVIVQNFWQQLQSKLSY
ncbi:YfcL family protein [Colwellia sp. RSH04]|uniref:YfcL family protein n=1 Tax=Colwellia sp. RSH04 TaxID=2305464 RepID=UPI000E595824|nr:YfcL family protein [Colwellia sp. RSH04]RHW75576.1 hypothetical protein D1094_12720 [Colwellia sp. RSH04]